MARTDGGWKVECVVSLLKMTEVGSALSHGAVVSREYCLPTIVNVKNAIKIINDGDYLLVDAGKGLVNIISEEEFKKKVA